MKSAVLLLFAAVGALQCQDNALPRVIRMPGPQYTQEALDAKAEGVVLLSATIGIDGTPAEIHVVSGLGRGLDEKAVEALRQWRFNPGLRNGKPIPVQATIEIKFRLPLGQPQIAMQFEK
jgi:TonB family protein